jgi:hypothetical protein
MNGPAGGSLIIKMPNPHPETIQRNYVPQVAVGGYEVAVN